MVPGGDQVRDAQLGDAECLLQEADDYVRRRTHRVEHVAGVDYEVHVPLQDGVHRPLVSLLNVHLPLVAVRGRVQLRVPRVTQMRVRDVGYTNYGLRCLPYILSYLFYPQRKAFSPGHFKLLVVAHYLPWRSQMPPA